METISTLTRDSLDQLLEQLAARLEVDSSAVVPFPDFTEMLTALLEFAGQDQACLWIAGHASPDVAIATERAGLKAVEILGASPFVGHPEDILEAAGTSSSLIYMANPNRVTGSSFSLNHLNRIAQKVSNGLLIIDETYFDYFGITGLPLLERHEQVVVLRLFGAGSGNRADASGCIIGSPRLVSGFKNHYEWSRITGNTHRLSTSSLTGLDSAGKRVTRIHDEAIRVANCLTQLGLQNRITSADFLLLRVADPREVARFLAEHGSPVDSLDIYPDLAGYLRYKVQSPGNNETFLIACSRMPSETYRMADPDKRAVMFHRPGESTPRSHADPPRSRNRVAGREANPKSGS
ncbi:MAG: aminotransferase class I/II-fold pyridoxal phosphate-dependent enzyme [Candidatus Zixiibacteriota bacterium]